MTAQLSAVLEELGLSAGEVRVYLALLKHGPSKVNTITRETKLHRTTIYDFLEKLGNKGLVSDVVQQGTHIYRAAPPDQLFELLESRKQNLTSIYDDLAKLQKTKPQEIVVEVLRGIEGFRRLTAEIVKAKQELLILGADEKEFEQRMSIEMKQVFRREREAGIRERIITGEGTFVYNQPNTEYRFIPKKYFSPTPTFLFGEHTAILIWEPFTIILIKNKQLTKSYRNYFKLLWQMARTVKNK